MLSLPSCVFGCAAFVHSHNPHCGKLDPRTVKYVLIGYPSNKKRFKYYHPLSRWVLVLMDVIFHEIESFFVNPPLQGESYLKIELVIKSLSFPTQDVQVQEIILKEFITEKAHNETREEDRYYEKQYQRHEKLTLVPQQVSILENPIGEVTDDMLEVSIPENPIYDVTDDMPIALRKGKQSCVKYPISQFVCIDHLYVVDKYIVGSVNLMGLLIDIYKTRLVAKKYTQTCGINYEETFAPIINMNTIRIIIFLAAPLWL
ncbi:hypothetical protein CR513_08658, partial [Mucuna pruriens]